MSDNMIEALAELQEANVALEKADVDEREASKAQTAARNRLNAAQKRIDELMTKLMANAPRNSDWRDRHDRRPQ